MKLLKTFALIAWIAFLSLSLVSGAYWIYSNVATVSVTQYKLENLTVTPTSIVQYHNVTLSVTLKLNGVPVGDGFKVEFGKGTRIDGSDFSSIGNSTTIVGVAAFEYNVTETDSVSFVARYSVP